MTQGISELNPGLDFLQGDDELSGGYADTLRALAEGETPQLEFLNRHSWSGGLSKNPWERILEGENLLSAAMLLTLSGTKAAEVPKLLEGIQAFASHCNWPEIPLITAQVQLLKVLTEGSQPEPLTEIKGVTPFAKGGYWEWADVPFAHQNSQLAIFYALIAFLGLAT